MGRFGQVGVWTAVLLATAAGPAFGLERVSLRTGFSVDCSRRETVGDRVRLYPADGGPGENYLEVGADAVVGVEVLPDVPKAVITADAVAAARQASVGSVASLSAADMREMLSAAGTAHNVDADLLASVVRAESGGHVRAVSRTGARGLMQLMPGTAAELGVSNAFAPGDNIKGGTAYLDALLTRYHDNLAMALAAYNAGPKAVDRYHGVPPYRETRAYVARVIREFNRRKLLAVAAVVAPAR